MAEEDYEVERVLKKRKVNGRAEYLVEWKNYPLDECTWQAADTLADCREKVVAYLRKHNEGSRRVEAAEVFCVCRRPQDGMFMLQCDLCAEWFHGPCVGVTEAGTLYFQAYMCFRCINKASPTQGKGVVMKAFAAEFAAAAAREKKKRAKGDEVGGFESEPSAADSEAEVEYNDEQRRSALPKAKPKKKKRGASKPPPAPPTKKRRKVVVKESRTPSHKSSAAATATTTAKKKKRRSTLPPDRVAVGVRTDDPAAESKPKRPRVKRPKEYRGEEIPRVRRVDGPPGAGKKRSKMLFGQSAKARLAEQAEAASASRHAESAAASEAQPEHTESLSPSASSSSLSSTSSPEAEVAQSRKKSATRVASRPSSASGNNVAASTSSGNSRTPATRRSGSNLPASSGSSRAPAAHRSSSNLSASSGNSRTTPACRSSSNFPASSGNSRTSAASSGNSRTSAARRSGSNLPAKGGKSQAASTSSAKSRPFASAVCGSSSSNSRKSSTSLSQPAKPRASGGLNRLQSSSSTAPKRKATSSGTSRVQTKRAAATNTQPLRSEEKQRRERDVARKKRDRHDAIATARSLQNTSRVSTQVSSASKASNLASGSSKLPPVGGAESRKKKRGIQTRDALPSSKASHSGASSRSRKRRKSLLTDSSSEDEDLALRPRKKPFARRTNRSLNLDGSSASESDVDMALPSRKSTSSRESEGALSSDSSSDEDLIPRTSKKPAVKARHIANHVSSSPETIDRGQSTLFNRGVPDSDSPNLPSAEELPLSAQKTGAIPDNASSRKKRMVSPSPSPSRESDASSLPSPFSSPPPSPENSRSSSPPTFSPSTPSGSCSPSSRTSIGGTSTVAQGAHAAQAQREKARVVDLGSSSERDLSPSRDSQRRTPKVVTAKPSYHGSSSSKKALKPRSGIQPKGLPLVTGSAPFPRNKKNTNSSSSSLPSRSAASVTSPSPRPSTLSTPLPPPISQSAPYARASRARNSTPASPQAPRGHGLTVPEKKPLHSSMAQSPPFSPLGEASALSKKATSRTREELVKNSTSHKTVPRKPSVSSTVPPLSSSSKPKPKPVVGSARKRASPQVSTSNVNSSPSHVDQERPAPALSPASPSPSPSPSALSCSAKGKSPPTTHVASTTGSVRPSNSARSTSSNASGKATATTASRSSSSNSRPTRPVHQLSKVAPTVIDLSSDTEDQPPPQQPKPRRRKPDPPRPAAAATAAAAPFPSSSSSSAPFPRTSSSSTKGGAAAVRAQPLPLTSQLTRRHSDGADVDGHSRSTPMARSASPSAFSSVPDVPSGHRRTYSQPPRLSQTFKSFTSKASTCHLADYVAMMCHKKFERLMDRAGVMHSGMTVLAGVVMQVDTEEEMLFTCVALGVGTKFLGRSIIEAGLKTTNGTCMHDSHAEVLARRRFRRYLLREVEKFVLYGDTLEPERRSIFEDRGKVSPRVGWKVPRLKLRDGVTFHFYTSSAPCGDASDFPQKGENRYSRNRADKVHPYSPDASQESAEIELPATLKLVEGPDIRPLPDRPHIGMISKNELFRDANTKKYHFMSCSDKMARWNVLGYQGALLTYMTDFVYMSSITVGRLHHSGALDRAMCRFQRYAHEDAPPRPKLYYSSRQFGRHDAKDRSDFSMGWNLGPQPDFEMSNGRIGTQMLGKTGEWHESVEGPPSQVSKAIVFHDFARVARIYARRYKLRADFLRRSYGSVKAAAGDYQRRKRVLHREFGHNNVWVERGPKMKNESFSL